MALISKMNRCAVCGSSSVVYNEEARTYHCASCGSDCAHTMPAADLALINRRFGRPEGRDAGAA